MKRQLKCTRIYFVQIDLKLLCFYDSTYKKRDKTIKRSFKKVFIFINEVKEIEEYLNP
jgi:hypothetical protein